MGEDVHQDLGSDVSPAPSLFDLSGRRALVTGSSRGIGGAIAEGLAGAGAHVVLHGRRRESLDRLRSDLSARGFTCSVEAFDLADPEAVDAGVQRIEDGIGPLDIVVNNAGMQKRARLAEFSLADWEALVRVNLTGAFLVSQRVAASMTQRRAGKIINVASVQSRLARPGITPYAATKGGLAMLTRGLCADLAPYGICVNALAPGYIETELTQALVENEQFSQWVCNRTPAGRWGRMADLVGTAIYLAAPASDFVNGQVIYVDGGMTAVV